MKEEKLRKLKDKLPRGHREEITKRTGFTLSYVDAVFGGRRFNQKIIDAAFEILKEEKEKEADQNALLN
ncbi:hypothetical protein DF185_19765 [Marinifilum breve]|uniref:Transcriptional regulator n=1 Tax=Marinifilum breve TaxID=2184082 RepID=A0A2V3ZT45_9BACT|nr:hypothetical protein [Marinifilum breve]PXX96879.1 hypothetical protein DF185_19765 [Marinifilum breve]